jgi:hypothetical protein
MGRYGPVGKRRTVLFGAAICVPFIGAPALPGYPTAAAHNSAISGEAGSALQYDGGLDRMT